MEEVGVRCSLFVVGCWLLVATWGIVPEVVGQLLCPSGGGEWHRTHNSWDDTVVGNWGSPSQKVGPSLGWTLALQISPEGTQDGSRGRAKRAPGTAARTTSPEGAAEIARILNVSGLSDAPSGACGLGHWFRGLATLAPGYRPTALRAWAAPAGPTPTPKWARRGRPAANHHLLMPASSRGWSRASPAKQPGASKASSLDRRPPLSTVVLMWLSSVSVPSATCCRIARPTTNNQQRTTKVCVPPRPNPSTRPGGSGGRRRTRPTPGRFGSRPGCRCLPRPCR